MQAPSIKNIVHDLRTVPDAVKGLLEIELSYQFAKQIPNINKCQDVVGYFANEIEKRTLPNDIFESVVISMIKSGWEPD